MSSLTVEQRRVLLRAFSYVAEGSPAENAKLLVTHAVDAGLVKPRRPIAGETLARWARDGSPPLWSALAAVAMLRANDYQPLPEQQDAYTAGRAVLDGR